MNDTTHNGKGQEQTGAESGFSDAGDSFFSSETVQTVHEQGSEAWIERALAHDRVCKAVDAIANADSKSEQQRTREKKELFLEVFANSLGTITLACDKAGIGRQTFYDWKANDGEFHARLIEIERQRVDMVEDRAMKLIMKDDGPTIRWWLSTTVEKYKAKKVLEHHTDDKTFEDVVDAILDELNSKQS
jgi:hypothetical protein